jgi:hypothetical protein
VALDRPGSWWIGSVDRFGREERECSVPALVFACGARIGAWIAFDVTTRLPRRASSHWSV